MNLQQIAKANEEYENKLLKYKQNIEKYLKNSSSTSFKQQQNADSKNYNNNPLTSSPKSEGTMGSSVFRALNQDYSPPNHNNIVNSNPLTISQVIHQQLLNYRHQMVYAPVQQVIVPEPVIKIENKKQLNLMNEIDQVLKKAAKKGPGLPVSAFKRVADISTMSVNSKIDEKELDTNKIMNKLNTKIERSKNVTESNTKVFSKTLGSKFEKLQLSPVNNNKASATNKDFMKQSNPSFPPLPSSKPKQQLKESIVKLKEMESQISQLTVNSSSMDEENLFDLSQSVELGYLQHGKLGDKEAESLDSTPPKVQLGTFEGKILDEISEPDKDQVLERLYAQKRQLLELVSGIDQQIFQLQNL